MHILQPIVTPQSFIFVPTKVASDVTDVILIDEVENTSVTINILAVAGNLIKYNNYYNLVMAFYKDGEFGLAFNRTYIIKIYNDDELIYKGKILSTTNTDLNANVYEERTTTNDFVIL